MHYPSVTKELRSIRPATQRDNRILIGSALLALTLTCQLLLQHVLFS